jgi:polyisoprenoid-binding protein YceI
MHITLHFRFRKPASVLCAAAALAWVMAANGQPRAISTEKSEMTVRVFKAGVFSAFGHDHEIAASIAGGTVDLSANRVELRVNASALRVRDPGASEKDRNEIQQTMLGPEVLDAGRHHEIVFQSAAAEPAGGIWQVRGTLTLHGESRPVMVEVREQGGHYVGSARLKQTDFGIKPIKVAGGAVKVKDEIRVDFDIQLEERRGRLP